MQIYYVILVLFISSLISYFSLRYLIPNLNRNILSIPNKRSSHTLPTPSGGGISFVSIS